MDDVLLGIVLGRLAEFPLPEQAADFLLAALDGDESLSAQLTGQAQPRSAALAVTTPSRPGRRLPAIADGQRIPGDWPARDFRGIAAPGADPSGGPQRQRKVKLRRSARGAAHRKPAALGPATCGLATGLAQYAPPRPDEDHGRVRHRRLRFCYGAKNMARGRRLRRVFGIGASLEGETGGYRAPGLDRGSHRLPSVPLAQRAGGILR